MCKELLEQLKMLKESIGKEECTNVVEKIRKILKQCPEYTSDSWDSGQQDPMEFVSRIVDIVVPNEDPQETTVQRLSHSFGLSQPSPSQYDVQTTMNWNKNDPNCSTQVTKFDPQNPTARVSINIGGCEIKIPTNMPLTSFEKMCVNKNLSDSFVSYLQPNYTVAAR